MFRHGKNRGRPVLDIPMFRRRFFILLALGFCGLLAVAARTFELAVMRHDANVGKGRRAATVKRQIFPPRARLLDRNGVPLAWSEHFYDLHYIPSPAVLPEHAEILLHRYDATLKLAEGVLRRNLTPEALPLADAALGTCPAFKIQERRERLRIGDTAMRTLLGDVAFEDKCLRGISGFELQYDATLRGEPAVFDVLLDRERNWIKDTWTLLTPLVPGQDVRLPKSLEEYQKEVDHAQQP